MDFAFTDEQEALREGVRTVLDTECTPDALRAFEMADEDGRAAQSQNRWAVLAELGAPALVVPESADGLGLSDVDLVGVLEEAGRAGLPEPLLETAALAAPTLAALLPDRAAAAALAALVRDDVSFAVGGIDVTPAGVVSPTEVSADGTLRTPRVVGARDAELLLLAVRDADSGWQLHAVPAASVHRVPHAGARARRAISRPCTGRWSSDTLLAYGVAAEAAVGLLADRAAAGTAALLIGLAERMLTMSADYAKERHQFGKPIGSFQAVKHLLADAAGGARVRPARHLPRRLVAGHGAAHALPRRVHGQGDGVGRGRPGGPGGPAGARGHRLHVGVRPPLLLEADVGALAGLGRRRHPPPAGPGPAPDQLNLSGWLRPAGSVRLGDPPAFSPVCEAR